MNERQQEVRAQLIARIARSITSANTTGRTVSDPTKAAEYAVNALTMWPEGYALLAEAAEVFAPTPADGAA